jgi:hypothetical protein
MSHGFGGFFVFTKKQLDDHWWPNLFQVHRFSSMPTRPSPSLRQPRPWDGSEDLGCFNFRARSWGGSDPFGFVCGKLSTNYNVDILCRLIKRGKIATECHEKPQIHYKLGDRTDLLDSVSSDDESKPLPDPTLQDVDSTGIINHELCGNIDFEIREVNLHPDVSTYNFHIARHRVYVIIAGAFGEDSEEFDSCGNPSVNLDNLTRGSRALCRTRNQELEGDDNHNGTVDAHGEN